MPMTGVARRGCACSSAAARTSAQLVRRASRVIGTRVVRTYGSTELPTSSMADPFGDLDAGATGEGKPMGRNEMTVRDEGDGPELPVRRPVSLPRLPRRGVEQDGVHRRRGTSGTGDQARVETDGTVHITGRIKDIINRGGEKFSVAEVEALLLDCPSVHDVAVVGFPYAVLVERACAYVVPGLAARPRSRSCASTCSRPDSPCRRRPSAC